MITIETDRKKINGEEISLKIFSSKTVAARWGGVFLHGAGESSKERGDALCMEMAKRGVQSVAFDFSGWGESTRHTQSSIQKRVDEASAVIEHFNLSRGRPLPLLVMAFSMSGQVAIELLRNFGREIRCLALFNPAIYSRQAIHVPFGPAFSEIIRRPYSWREADIASAFDGYTGKTMLLRSEHDEVIPPEVFFLIAQAAPAGGFSEFLVESACHQLGSFLNSHAEVVARVADAIVNLLETQDDGND